MKLLFMPMALRNIEALPKAIQRRITNKMAWYAAQEHPLSFAKPLINSQLGKYRFRIGNYRVFVDIVHGQITVLIVLAIRSREQAYD